MGRPLPGWEVAMLDEDEQPLPRRGARRDLPEGALEPALPDRLLEPARGHRGGVRRRLVPHQGRRRARRGRLRLVRGPRRRRDHLGRLPHRPVRGRVGVRGAPGGQGGRGGGLTRPQARRHREGVHRAGRAATSRPTSWPSEIKAHVRERHSAYAYPREIEFVDDLPKTLTGKIRRVELREQERERKQAATRRPSADGHQRDVPEDRRGRRRRRRPAPRRSRRARAASSCLLRAVGGAVAPDDHALHPALGPVELERQEAEPEQDRDDPGPGHAGAAT